jgi:hypothetical protein
LGDAIEHLPVGFSLGRRCNRRFKAATTSHGPLIVGRSTPSEQARAGPSNAEHLCSETSSLAPTRMHDVSAVKALAYVTHRHVLRPRHRAKSGYYPEITYFLMHPSRLRRTATLDQSAGAHAPQR